MSSTLKVIQITSLFGPYSGNFILLSNICANTTLYSIVYDSILHLFILRYSLYDRVCFFRLLTGKLVFNILEIIIYPYMFSFFHTIRCTLIYHVMIILKWYI